MPGRLSRRVPRSSRRRSQEISAARQLPCASATRPPPARSRISRSRLSQRSPRRRHLHSLLPPRAGGQRTRGSAGHVYIPRCIPRAESKSLAVGHAKRWSAFVPQEIPLKSCHPERSEGSVVRRKMQIPRFARDEQIPIWKFVRHHTFLALHHFRPPQIMEVHNPPQPPMAVHVAIHHDERRNLHLFHPRQRTRRELLRTNGLRSPRHAILRRQIERVLAALLEQPPQITVADHTQQTVALDHCRHAQLLARHFVIHVRHLRLRRHPRNCVP